MIISKNHARKQESRLGEWHELFSPAQKASYTPFPLIGGGKLQVEAPGCAVPRELDAEIPVLIWLPVAFQETASGANDLRHESGSQGISEPELCRKLVIDCRIVIGLFPAI